MKYEQKNINQILKELSADQTSGLSNEEAKKRLFFYGKNVIQDIRAPSLLSVFFDQFRNPLIYLLLVAAGVIFFLANPLDACVIAGVLFFNAFMGTLQEGRTRNIINSLKQYLQADALVIRDGKKIIISDENLVPGDIIILQKGDKVPADARLIQAENVVVDESMLTGESHEITKTVLQEKENQEQYEDGMLFKGTYILTGFAQAIVIYTGQSTRIGTISSFINPEPTKMPLAQDIEHMAHIIVQAILGICALLFFIGMLQGRPFADVLVMLTALFICVIPECLPAVFTLVLVTGAHRMANRGVIVKKLQAAEALGRIDAIIFDKTGTLTENELIVSSIITNTTQKIFTVTGQGYKAEGKIYDADQMYQGNDEDLNRIAEISWLLNTTKIEYQPATDLYKIKGDRTEAALFVFAEKMPFNTHQIESSFKKIYQIPFLDYLQFKVSFYQYDSKIIALLTGSPEALIMRSTDLSDFAKQAMNNAFSQGLRIIACAYKYIDYDPKYLQKLSLDKVLDLIKNDIILSGICCLQDAIRIEAAAMIKQAQSMGVSTIIATGDHKETALFVAKQVHLVEENDEITDGKTLNTYLANHQIDEILRTKLFFRVKPEEKLAIVKTYHEKNRLIAMIGDGINDVPSLVAADLGISLGNIGTEVAKEASDIILLHDSFDNLVQAIMYSRNIFYSLRRIITYFFATNLGELLIIVVAILLNFKEMPFQAVQILWLNLITDGFLDAALAMEPSEQEMLTQKILSERLITKTLLKKSFFMALPMAIGSLILFWYYHDDVIRARTIVVVAMTFFQTTNAWNCRSEYTSFIQKGIFSNIWLVATTLLIIVLQLLLLYNPWLQYLFRTTSLTLANFGMILLVTIPIFIYNEVKKYTIKKISFSS